MHESLNQLSNSLDAIETRLTKIRNQRITNSPNEPANIDQEMVEDMLALIQFAKSHTNDQIRHNTLFKNSNSKDLQEQIDRLKVSIAKAKGINMQLTNDKETSLNLIHYLDKAYDKLRDIQYQMISDSSIENIREQLDELVNTVADTRSNLSNHTGAYPIGSHEQRDRLWNQIAKIEKTIHKKEDNNMAMKQIEEEKTYPNYADGGSNMVPPYRAQILDKAKECVSGQRVQDYGTPEDNFGDIASAWNWYLRDHLKTDLLPRDVALMMTLMKVARAKNGGGSGDSFVDIAGYAACCAEIDHNAKEA